MNEGATIISELVSTLAGLGVAAVALCAAKVLGDIGIKWIKILSNDAASGLDDRPEGGTGPIYQNWRNQ